LYLLIPWSPLFSPPLPPQLPRFLLSRHCRSSSHRRSEGPHTCHKWLLYKRHDGAFKGGNLNAFAKRNITPFYD
jgi:hypothetical protein